MKLLVIGGTGTVGSNVVRELVARGDEVHVLSRDGGKAKGVVAGARAVAGELLDPNTIRTAFRRMEGVMLINSLSPTETHEGLMAVNGAMMAHVGRLVYLSVHNCDRWAHLPHFGAKLAIETVVQQSGIPWTILRPNNFFQNDLWMRQAILEYGVYPQPLGDIGCSRVDVQDIGEIAAKVLVADGHAGKTYNIVGPEALTGARCAELWSEALGRPIAYGGNDLDAWEQQQLQFLPPWLAFDARMMLAEIQHHGFLATAADLATTTALLGHPPRAFAGWVQETAAQWTS